MRLLVYHFNAAAPTPELSEFERNMVGETRFQDLEPIAKFIDAGATVAFGSDWPIDDFDEWYDLKVAATRRGHDIDGKKRLGSILIAI